QPRGRRRGRPRSLERRQRRARRRQRRQPERWYRLKRRLLLAGCMDAHRLLSLSNLHSNSE
ncbi:unnamed protein product, partial [Pylaiella littoralis]